MVDDPSAFTFGMGQLKDGIDLLRSVVGLVKDAKETLPEGQHSEAITTALEQSERQVGLAEAEIAKGLGYQLCRCEFPPTIMLAVGTTKPRGNERAEPVYQCPKCGVDTAYPYGFNRAKTLPNTRDP